MLRRLHRDYAVPVNAQALASDAGLSTSALHLDFRAITGTASVQYVITIRL